ncbi:MAG: carboxylesterase family protein [Sphingobium sp.]
MASDLAFAMLTRNFATRHAAAGAPTWFYRFDLGGLLLGPTHGVELAYLWGWRGLRTMLGTGGPMIGKRARLARRMRRAWIDFIRNGDPGPRWPRFQADAQQILLLDAEDSVAPDPDAERRRLWAGRDVLVRTR